MVANPRENRKSVSNAEEELKLLSLVDILEPLSREDLAGLNWKHLDSHRVWDPCSPSRRSPVYLSCSHPLLGPFVGGAIGGARKGRRRP
jgi:hypothetical protein